MSEELILSPADPAWHERRREVYTASDMGVLFGLPGFGGRTLSDVWYEKRFGLKEDKGTPSTRLGQRMEPLILDEAETELGVRIIDRQRWLCDGQIGATLDGRCEDTGNPVEAKTAGLLWKADSEWGDEGDEVPSAIVLQVQAQILVTDSDRAHVAALIGGRGGSMKILGILPGGYRPHECGAIVQLDYSELCRIIGGARYAGTGTLKPGTDVEIDKRFDHAQEVLAAATAAKKLPQALRAFADTLETLHPAIDDITDPVIDASFEVTP